MSSDLVTRVGDAIPDVGMQPYDHKNKKHRVVDWTKKDKTFSMVQESLIQKAGSWDLRSTHIIPERTPISNQGHAGSCVANAWCDAMEILDGLVGTDKVEQLSRRFLYWCSRYYTGDTHKDKGTYLRSAAHQLMKIGIFEEEYFEYNDDDDYILSGRPHASPIVDHYTMASNNRLAGFYRAESLMPASLLKELEIAIRSNHPVTFGAPVGKEFQAYRGGGQIFTVPGSSIGGHAMIITGVGFDGEKRWWLLRNSWGKHWGDDGHVKVDDDYVLAFHDIWIGTKMKDLI